jgi:hypothetical protein
VQFPPKTDLTYYNKYRSFNELLLFLIANLREYVQLDLQAL